VEPQSAPLSSAAGPPASAASAHLPNSDPSTALLPTKPCPGCTWARQWLEGRQQAGYWKCQFDRCKQREERLRQQLAELKTKNWQHLYEQALDRERSLQQRVATLEAQILVLEKRLRGRKSERKKRHSETVVTSPSTPARPRGQQPTNPAPQRRTFDHLPTQEEPCELPAAAARCPHCDAPFAPFPGSDDGDLIEIDVRAHRRRYRRRRYAKTCTCAATPAIITAPPPPKLVPKGYLGISVWVLLLLEKYAAYQPTYRFLALLRSFGIDLPLGTVTDGLKKLVPLFEPLYQALAEHQRHEHHWHCDETRWLVFVEQEGKVGPYWSLWVFVSPQAVVFVLDPTRTHDVPEKHLVGATGIASVDRASTYKAMAQVKEGQIVLAFCWAHLRRDFLEVLTGYAQLNDWVISWLEDIRELYRLNEARLDVLTVSPAAADRPALPVSAPSSLPLPFGAEAVAVAVGVEAVADHPLPPTITNGQPVAAIPSHQPAAVTAPEQELRDHVAHLAQRRDAELQQPNLHPAGAKVLTSMQNHWSGLTVFLDHPEVPLDNNTAERAERGPVVARKNYYGSGALWSGRLAAMMFSLLQTLALWNLCPLRWLTAYLTACAKAGAQPPRNAASFLPWNLTAEQKQQWAVPSSQRPAPPADNTS
jgi:transposase